MNWPVLYKDILLAGDLNSNVGICSLWTEREIVKRLVNDKSKYAVIGNLYSAQGINAIIRNVMANPKIRYIILWGAEMSLSGQALVQLIKAGIDKKRNIVGARGEIENEIPLSAINQFRRAVEVIDLRGKDKSQLRQTLRIIKPKPRFGKRRIFKPAQPRLTIMPSESTGFKVEAPKVAQTWLKLLNVINHYGRPKHTRYAQKNELKEILNLTAVVSNENPDKIYFPDYLPFSKAELKAYYPEIMTARKIPGVAYNYGERLRKHFGVDQVKKIKELLKARPASKKMLGVTVDVKLDWGRVNKGDTPCLTQVLGSVYDNKFYFTGHFRSQDMVHGWPRNAFGLRKLQQDIARSTGFKLGPLIIITHSAHIYSDDFKLVDDLLKDHYEKELGFTPAVHFEFDPRGNLVVEVIKEKEAKVWPEFWEKIKNQPVPLAIAQGLKRVKGKGKLIRATLYAPNGGPVIKLFEGRTAQEVAWQITDWNYLVMPGHVIYIGLELQRAEEAIATNRTFVQDPA
jgi:thymidylate synthase